MGWYIFACVWATGAGFVAGMLVGVSSMLESRRRQPMVFHEPLFNASGVHCGTIERVRAADLHPISRN